MGVSEELGQEIDQRRLVPNFDRWKGKIKNNKIKEYKVLVSLMIWPIGLTGGRELANLWYSSRSEVADWTIAIRWECILSNWARFRAFHNDRHIISHCFNSRLESLFLFEMCFDRDLNQFDRGIWVRLFKYFIYIYIY